MDGSAPTPACWETSDLAMAVASEMRGAVDSDVDSLLEGVPSADEGISSGTESHKRKQGARLVPVGEEDIWPPLSPATMTSLERAWRGNQ